MSMQTFAMPCGFDEEFIDFESAQYSLSCTDEWSISELDDEALGIETKSSGTKTTTGCRESSQSQPKSCAKSSAASSSTSSVTSTSSAMKVSTGSSPGGGDLFGCSRNYSPSFGRSRPTLISAKYRLKEERRKVLKISINKLKKIEDPESSLRRSVLINNTMKRLQREAREEKLQKQGYQPRSFTSSFTSYSKSFTKDITEDSSLASPTTGTTDITKSCVSSSTPPSLHGAPLISVPSATSPMSMEPSVTANLSSCTSSAISKMECVCDDSIELVDVTGLRDDDSPASSCIVTADSSSETTSKKRRFDECEDCDVQDVLSQFYMPPTPRMLTSIDDDDQVDDQTTSSEKKRPRIDCSDVCTPMLETSDPVDVTKVPSSPSPLTALTVTNGGGIDCVSSVTSEPVDNRLCASEPEVSESSGEQTQTRLEASHKDHEENQQQSRFCSDRKTNGGSLLDTDQHQFSCGHASIFGELQSVVFHSLIASLES